MIAGYAISHPALLGAPPRLNSLLSHLPEQAECLYIHDVALLSHTRKMGLGSSLMQHVKKVAIEHKLSMLALVAVGDSGSYWQRQGFVPWADEAHASALRNKMASYDSKAQYMVQSLV